MQLFGELFARDTPFGISAYTYREVLQGARDEAELQTLREYLSTQHIYYLEQDAATYEKAAMLYLSLTHGRPVVHAGTGDLDMSAQE